MTCDWSSQQTHTRVLSAVERLCSRPMELVSPQPSLSPTSTPRRSKSLWAASEGKRAVEQAYLLYTPVWGASAGLVMLSGAAEAWGDLELLIFGISMMLGALIAPFLSLPASEQARPFHERTATKMVLCVVLLSFGLNYTQTPFFWEVLHMHYGFSVTWTIDQNPIFLYALTVAYFSTYVVLCTMAFRLLSTRLAGRMGRLLAYCVAPFAMALLETLLNANPFIAKLFCYDDVGLALTFGTFSYGIAFVLMLPIWIALDEKEGVRMPLFQVAVLTLAALYVDLLLLDFLKATVAPHLTTVVEGARGLRDAGPNCLHAP